MAEGLQTRSARRTARDLVVVISVVGVLAVSPLVGPASAYPSILDPKNGAHFGAFVQPRGSESNSDAVRRLERDIDRRLAIDHHYYKWNSPIPTAHQVWDKRQGRIPFLNWKAQRTDGRLVAWEEIANGSHDAWIRRRARAFRRFSAPVYLTFHHEPEDDLGSFGSPDDYADAYRRIVTVFRDEDVTNVAFVWTMMAWTFDPRSGHDPMAYYPGDGYVDLVGADGYNWHGVRSDEPWREFAMIFADARAFSREHGKPWLVVEYGVVEDVDEPRRKARWFRLAGRTAQRWASLAGLVYFDSIRDGNHWASDSSRSSIRAFRRVGHADYFEP